MTKCNCEEVANVKYLASVQTIPTSTKRTIRCVLQRRCVQSFGKFHQMFE